MKKKILLSTLGTASVSLEVRKLLLSTLGAASVYLERQDDVNKTKHEKSGADEERILGIEGK
eukprot:scaffold19299_cov51-Attheya_sp.AAC.2